jgi:hypothetical protein
VGPDFEDVRINSFVFAKLFVFFDESPLYSIILLGFKITAVTYSFALNLVVFYCWNSRLPL